jgi:hypothetical protein
VSTAIGHRPGRFRFVLLAGITAGTALAIFATINGLHFALPGLPGPLSTIASALAEWVLAVSVATAGVELLRRHHKALASGVWRRARARSEGLTGRLAAWAGPRWERRHAPVGGAGTAAVQAPPALAPVSATIPVAAPAAAAPPKNGDQPMTTATEPIPAGPPMDRTRARAAKLPAPSALWRALAAAAADFVPESEAEAAEWLREQAAGLFAFAEGVMGAHANTVDGRAWTRRRCGECIRPRTSSPRWRPDRRRRDGPAPLFRRGPRVPPGRQADDIRRPVDHWRRRRLTLVRARCRDCGPAAGPAPLERGRHDPKR